MRSLVIIPLAIALAVAGCGSSKREAAPRTATNAVVIKPLGGVGHWAKLLLSLDGNTWLGQWSGECEVQETYFIPAAGGAPRPVTGHRGDESIALGWALHNRARILVPRAACGGQFGKPGIYLVGRDGNVSLVKRVKARPGGA